MSGQTVFVTDDDGHVRDSLCALLLAEGFAASGFPSATAFLAHLDVLLSRSGLSGPACLITDVRMPGMSGIELLEEVMRRKISLPVIVVTGHGDVPLAVQAMKAGATDFIEKPYDGQAMLSAVSLALKAASSQQAQASVAQQAQARLSGLTQRERQVLDLLVGGASNKQIAFELDISPRTVEIHRAHVMDKMQAKSLSELVRLALAAGSEG